MADLKGRLAFVMGNEANGVSPALLAEADKRVFIPMQGRADSLNVAMAAGIVMFEALRQKLKYFFSFCLTKVSRCNIISMLPMDGFPSG